MSFSAEDAHRTDGSLRQEEVLCVFSAHISSPSSKHFARKFTEKDSLTGTRTGKIWIIDAYLRAHRTRRTIATH